MHLFKSLRISINLLTVKTFTFLHMINTNMTVRKLNSYENFIT